jgi:hypothetical protein
MKKMLSLFICWSLPVFAAADVSNKIGQLSVLDGDARDALSGKSKYDVSVHHWSFIEEDSYFQRPGFAAVVMKCDNGEAWLNPFIMCRKFALQLQYNSNNNVAYSTSSPVAVLQETRAKIDQQFSDQVTQLGVVGNAAVKAMAVLFASIGADDDDFSIIFAEGVKKETEANYLPQFTTVRALTREDMPFELRLPETEDAPDAPIVLWQAAK